MCLPEPRPGPMTYNTLPKLMSAAVPSLETVTTTTQTGSLMPCLLYGAQQPSFTVT